MTRGSIFKTANGELTENGLCNPNILLQKSKRAVVVLRGKTDLSALEVGDVDEAGGSRGGAGGLVHGGGEGGAVGDLVELLSAEIVEQHVEGENVLDGVDGEVFGEECRHGGVVDGADGDGGAVVDVGGQVC